MEIAINKISLLFKSKKVKSLHDQPQVEMATDRERISSYEQTNVSSSGIVKENVYLNESFIQ